MTKCDSYAKLLNKAQYEIKEHSEDKCARMI